MTLPVNKEFPFERLFFAYSRPVFGLVLLIFGAWLLGYAPILGFILGAAGGAILYRWSGFGDDAWSRRQSAAPREVIVHIDGEGVIYLLADGSVPRLEGSAARHRVETLVRANQRVEVLIQTNPQTPTKALVDAIDWLARIRVAPMSATTIADV